MERRRFLEIVTTVSAVGIAGCSGSSENGDSGGTDDSSGNEDSGGTDDGGGNEDSGGTDDGGGNEDSSGTDDGGGSTRGGAQQSSSIAVAEAYYTADSAEAASDFVHPASDLEPDPVEYSDELEVTFLEGEIIAEDADIQVLEDRELSPFSITETVLENIRQSEQVHLVEATLEYQSGDESDEVPQMILPATDGGDWYVLDEPAQTA
jgi:hypothetical protein